MYVMNFGNEESLMQSAQQKNSVTFKIILDIIKNQCQRF